MTNKDCKNNAMKFVVKKATITNIPFLEYLQSKIYFDLSEKNIYYPLSHEEFIESLKFDDIYCAWHDNEIVAFAVLVSNRNTQRNLCKYFDNSNCEPEHNLTFDAVGVSPDFRGYGLQKEMLKISIEKAKKMKIIHSISATVAPENFFSVKNFIEMGFAVKKTDLVIYGGLNRILLVKEIN